MSYSRLLDATNAPLSHLALHRVQLDQGCPYVSLEAHAGETLLYSLVGRVAVYVDGDRIGSLGGRERMSQEIVQCLRACGCKTIAILLETFAADLLWFTHAINHGQGVPHVYKQDEAVWHTVGEGTHLRRVAEVSTPPWASIACGETWNIPGGISSYPPHATQGDLDRFANGETTWEEVMWFACNAPGIANLQGVYTGGRIVNTLVPIYNGDAHVMPLGSHAIHAGPGASMQYVWAYSGTALQKVYNRAADDLGTYRT